MPVPTSTSTADRYEYTCQVGQGPDSSGASCTSGYFGETYEYRGGTWWSIRTYCMAQSECERVQGPPLEEYAFLPCVPHLTPGGIVLECRPSGEIQTWNVRAEVNTACPINEVMRAPYPRSLVNAETTFMLEPHEYNVIEGVFSAPQSPANLDHFLDDDGLPSEDGYSAGIWKNLRLVMRSRRFNGGETWFGQTVPRPQWVFTDRAWNDGPLPATQSGQQARYVYQTSSAGLPTTFGRGFDAASKAPSTRFDLPAYAVNLTTYCGHEWKVEVELATRTWNRTGACYATRINPDGSTETPAGTSNEGCDPGYVAPGEWVYGWENNTTAWAGIDLTQIGRPTTYDFRTRTTSGGVFKGREYVDDPTGIWVPVIEIQSVLRDECVAAGTCAPPQAEPGSTR